MRTELRDVRELLRIAIGKLGDEDGAEGTEHRHGRPNPQSEGEQRRSRKTWSAAELPQAELHVVKNAHASSLQDSARLLHPASGDN